MHPCSTIYSSQDMETTEMPISRPEYEEDYGTCTQWDITQH